MNNNFDIISFYNDYNVSNINYLLKRISKKKKLIVATDILS